KLHHAGLTAARGCLQVDDCALGRIHSEYRKGVAGNLGVDGVVVSVTEIDKRSAADPRIVERAGSTIELEKQWPQEGSSAIDVLEVKLHCIGPIDQVIALNCQRQARLTGEKWEAIGRLVVTKKNNRVRRP